MKNGLIGYTGFVGSTLMKQMVFDDLYRSTNIESIRGKSFATVVCAGAPAQKWLANKEPAEDERKIDGLIENLDKIKADRFVLISTVDVFQNPIGVNELSPVQEKDLHAYGLNRRKLEKFVESKFSNHLIVRLPGLVGPGLRKNVIFDFLNDNNINQVDSRGSFQFYPMVNLWSDIEIAQKNGLKLLHLTCEPVTVSEIAREAFLRDFTNEILPKAPSYDFQSVHTKIFSAEKKDYQYTKRESLLAIRAYAQSEPRKIS